MAAQLSRRRFLGALLACTAIGTISTPAFAGPSSTIVLEAYESTPGSGKFDRLKIPTDMASSVGKARAQALEAASNRALRIAQSQNLSRPKANGLLTRLWRPSLRSAAKGIGPALLEAGLVVGLTLALANATVELSKTSSTLTMSASECANLPVMPSQITSASTGIYRSSSGSAGQAYQRTVITSTSTGTMPAPSGWSWAYQRQIGNPTYNEAGKAVYQWETWFSKQVACGERVAFPPTADVDGSIPKSGGEQNSTDQNSDTNRGKIIDGLWNGARAEQPTKPMPGGEIPGEVEEPGVTIPAPAEAGPGTVKTPTPIVPADLTTPTPAPVPDPENTHVKFPPEVALKDPDSTSPTPTPTPGSTPTPSGPQTIDWGSPPADDPVPGVTPMTWFPTMFQPPQVAGQCSGWEIPVPKVNSSIKLDPCPSLATLSPVVRPVCVVSATVVAGKILLDV